MGGHTGFTADPLGVGVGVDVGVPELAPMISLEPMNGISPNLHGYISGTGLKARRVLMTLTSFSRSQ